MGIAASLKKRYRKEQFDPGVLGLLVNPFYFARVGLIRSVRRHADAIHGNVLDIGCGRKPYQSLFSYDRYTGMDVEQSGHDHSDEVIDVFYDGTTYPFPDNSFDSALCNQVLEHVFEPIDFMKEAHRVLKPGGTLLLTVPFAWDEHEQPYDYARYSSFGLRHLVQKAGFEIVKQEKITNDIRAVFQILNTYIYKKTITRSFVLNVLLTLLLMAPFNVLAQLLHYVLPKNDDLYLDNLVVLRKR